MMKRSFHLVALALLFVAHAAWADAPATRPAQTAADVLRPVLERIAANLTEADDAALGKLSETPFGPMNPVTPQAAAVAARFRPQLDALAQAAGLPAGGAQWRNLDDVLPDPADWVWNLRHVGKLATIDAVALADADDVEAAHARLASLLDVSHLLVRQPESTTILLGQLNAVAAGQAAGRIAHRFDDGQIASLRDGFAAASQTADAEAVRETGRAAVLLFRRSGNDLGVDKVDPMLRPLFDVPPEAAAQWADPIQRERLTKSVERAYNATADALAARGDERAAKLAEAEKHIAATDWLARIVGPFPDLDLKSQARFDALLALASAAMDVRLRGEAALAEHPDPTDGKPFDYESLGDGGFVLTSRHEIGDGPAAFRVEPRDPR